ncbi:MAG: response regulator [Spirochaetes bacterium]|nr:MAG: response regulator [Spirochaetota bacterium]
MEPKHILCADDERANLALLEALLLPRGYRVTTAENGIEALAFAMQHNVDLILLDVMMPTLNGFEVCKQLKQDERFRRVPIVLLTSLRSKQDRIKGIEAGAEDFISKPFNQGEVLARIAMLLRMKELDDQLEHAYTNINSMTHFGEQLIKNFDPMRFDLAEGVKRFVSQIIAGDETRPGKPRILIVGIAADFGWEWRMYSMEAGVIVKSGFDMDLHDLLTAGNGSNIGFLNNSDLESGKWEPLGHGLAGLSIEADNLVFHADEKLTVMAVNYGRTVTRHDAAVLNNLVLNTMFLKSLSVQIKETENAFEYTIQALARASEANDEDTGNHIMRVGEYSAALARELGFPETFIRTIRFQAPMHDIGKIHVHPDILKKPGKLTAEEFEKNKLHTVQGGKILGEHPRLAMARSIALTHHERWDGTGYPRRLQGDAIPPEGRILTIADQYDALRNARVYKPAYDHPTAHAIITEGDGRTLPAHFDPQVLAAYRKISSKFEEIYDRLA